MDASVAVCTFGSQRWQKLAQSRAIPSAQQLDVPLIIVHSDSLANARNEALAQAQTEYIIYLDADDELPADYVKQMAKGTADIRVPVKRQVNGVNRASVMPSVSFPLYHRKHQCTGECLIDGNWIVVGAAAKTELLRAVGGWGDEEMYEDWSMWARCWVHGCTIEPIYNAVYLWHRSVKSRNHQGNRQSHLYWHYKIGHSIWPERYEDPDA